MLPAEYTQKLAERLADHDPAALHELYVGNFDSLQRYAYRYVYDWEEAKDIVQSAFLQMWVNTRHLKKEINPRGYLVKIVHNLCSNYLRHLDIVDSNREKLVEATVFMELCGDNPEIDPDTKRKLDAALRKLPPRGYEILMTHIVDGKKNAEIAEILGITESTVKVHLRNAMRVLRDNMLLAIFGLV